MKIHPKYLAGHSLVEMMIALVITTLAVAAATSGLVFWVRGERYNSIQSELDMNVRKTMENLKRDLRLSALDKIYFYPPGPGPYTAISFPVAADTNNDGLVEMTADGSNILWQSTVIYHVWSGSPNELRRTEFTPRDNSLTDAQAQEQLTSVVTNGNGSLTYGAANARSRKIFANLFTWSIWGKGAIFDGYSPIIERDTSVSFGSILLGNGNHTVKFSVIGKNASSSGFKIGVDTLTASPCGVEREGEYQLPVAAQSGATAAGEYMSQGSWNGNYQLSFPATTTGNYFTVNFENDRWEERHFKGQGALRQRTIVGFDPNLSPKDYILQLEGSPGYPWGSPDLPYAWMAENQTGSSYASSNSSLTGCVVRIPVRGGSLAQNAGALLFSGHYPYVYLMPSGGPLKIRAIYIAEAADHTNYTMNAKGPGVQLFRIGTSDPVAESGWVEPGTAYAIDASKSYLISFLVDSEAGNLSCWPETHAGAPGAYIIPASAAPTAADAQAADWSSKPVAVSNSIFGIWAIYTTYPTNGLFTSQVFDTKIETPVYSTVSWSSIKPSGTSVKIKVRTGTQADLTDAPAWSNVTAFLSSPANITCGNKRYVQFQAILNPDTSGWNTPKLQDVTIKWAGDTKVVDVAAMMSKGPNYGICEVRVDDKPLVKGLQIDLTIFKTILGWGPVAKQLTSSMSTEIEPRNTGK